MKDQGVKKLSSDAVSVTVPFGCVLLWKEGTRLPELLCEHDPLWPDDFQKLHPLGSWNFNP